VIVFVASRGRSPLVVELRHISEAELLNLSFGQLQTRFDCGLIDEETYNDWVGRFAAAHGGREPDEEKDWVAKIHWRQQRGGKR
jgi:hypothetical protein